MTSTPRSAAAATGRQPAGEEDPVAVVIALVPRCLFTPALRRAELRRMREAGWQLWEVRRVLGRLTSAERMLWLGRCSGE